MRNSSSVEVYLIALLPLYIKGLYCTCVVSKSQLCSANDLVFEYVNEALTSMIMGWNQAYDDMKVIMTCPNISHLPLCSVVP